MKDAFMRLINKEQWVKLFNQGNVYEVEHAWIEVDS